MVTRNRVQGETVKVACTAPLGLASVYAIFKGPSGSPLTVQASRVGSVLGDCWWLGIGGWSDYGPMPPLESVWVIPQDTTAFPVGLWALELWTVATTGAKTVLVVDSFSIVASIGSGGSNDVRSQAAIAVEAIEAILADPANAKAQSYKINNRELSRYSIGELRNLLGYWKTKLRNENIRAMRRRGVIGRRIEVRL